MSLKIMYRIRYIIKKNILLLILTAISVTLHTAYKFSLILSDIYPLKVFRCLAKMPFFQTSAMIGVVEVARWRLPRQNIQPYGC